MTTEIAEMNEKSEARHFEYYSSNRARSDRRIVVQHHGWLGDFPSPGPAATSDTPQCENVMPGLPVAKDRDSSHGHVIRSGPNANRYLAIPPNRSVNHDLRIGWR